MLTVIGQGYVGLPLAMLAVGAGHDVVGLDVDAARVELLRQGRSYVDDIDDAQLRAAVDSGRYIATADYSDVAGFDVAVITVPTPLRNRIPDLSFVLSAANEPQPLHHARQSGRAGVDNLSRHDRGSGSPPPGRRQRLDRRARLRTRLQP